MARGKKHYLNRYATPTDFDIDQASPFAEVIASDSYSTSEKVSAAIDFSHRITIEENRHWADYESRTVQRLDLVNALRVTLKANGCNSADYTSTMSLRLGEQLHWLPIRNDFESIVQKICHQYPLLTFHHLLKMARHLVIEAESIADIERNQERCLQFSARAVGEGWSSKKLESEIKKHLGLRAGGRPRKSR